MLPTTKILKNGITATFRYLLKEDLEDIWKIFNQVVAEKKYIPVVDPVTSRYEKENWYYRQQDEDNIVVVAEIFEDNENHVVGQCMIEHVGWDAAMHVGELGIIIAPPYRNIGIGKTLILEALKAAPEKDFEKVTLSCFNTNRYAFNLYKKLGFRKVGCRKQQFKLNGVYYDEILMEISLEDLTAEE